MQNSGRVTAGGPRAGTGGAWPSLRGCLSLSGPLPYRPPQWWAGHTLNLWSAMPLPTEPEIAETTTYDPAATRTPRGHRREGQDVRDKAQTPANNSLRTEGSSHYVGPQRRRPGPQAKWYETWRPPAAEARTRGPGSSPGSSVPTNAHPWEAARTAQGLGPCLLHGEAREAPGAWLQPGQLCLGWTCEDDSEGEICSSALLKQNDQTNLQKPHPPPWSRAVSAASLLDGTPQGAGKPLPGFRCKPRENGCQSHLGSNQQPQGLVHHLCIGICGPTWQRSHAAAAQAGTHKHLLAHQN